MNETDNQIITGVDKLLNLVKEREEISLTDAARQLKVPKGAVLQWCETLEENNLLVTNRTLKETFLMSKDFHKYQSGFVRSFIQNAKSLSSDTKLPGDDAIRVNEQAITDRLSVIKKKSRELKRFAEIKEAAEQRLTKLAKATKDYNKLKRQLSLEKKALEKESEAFEAEKTRVAEKELKMLAALARNAEKEKEFQQKTKAVGKAMRDFDTDVRNLEKDRESFERKTRSLARRQAQLREQYGQLAVRQKAIDEIEKMANEAMAKSERKMSKVEKQQLSLDSDKILLKHRDTELAEHLKALAENQRKVQKQAADIINLLRWDTKHSKPMQLKAFKNRFALAASHRSAATVSSASSS
jgi:hypothetical protein